MKKIKYIFATTTPITFFGSSLVASSCSQEQEKSEIKLRIYAPYSNETQKEEFKKSFNEKLKEKENNFKINFDFSTSDDYLSNVNAISNNEIDFAFVSSGAILDKEDEIKELGLKLGIQTHARLFKGSLNENNEKYSDGSNSDPLVKMAKNQEVLFKKYERSEWSSKNNPNKWNGSIFEEFYENNKSTPYQRGMIYIVANQEDKQKIEQAWFNKDFNKFLSFGIGIGKPSSGSKYILPEALFKKHFGSQFKSFAALQTDPQKSKNIKVASLKNINDQGNDKIKIYFDNEGIYTWTKVKNPDSLTPKNSDVKIYFLTTTDVLPYNVGLFNKSVSQEQIDIITSILIELSQSKQDSIGISNGFAGYSNISKNPKDFWKTINETLNK
ncbi:ABC transporter thiamine pyrophosphate-binding lipoprotein p37/Cypl [Mycoplasma leonicaptivi]|uniref:ABC transporter thiamine pyrophosphate-binding lipoprotein p37/Cypl n=1 Tax=Mycoplasma leonicaptivi TaxID=36742 RepID=UPI0004805CBD|nr:hypothetical protein [Mycoplasma leonicaptivi]